MSKNVMIPIELFANIVELLDCLDLSKFEPSFQRACIDTIWELKAKMQKMELRDAYSKIVAAKNSNDRDWARVEYLRLKNQHLDLRFGY